MNLIEACKQNDVTRIRDLIREGANINEVYYDELGHSTTALYEAISENYVDAVRVLMDNHVDINWVNPDIYNQTYLITNIEMFSEFNGEVFEKKKNIFHQLINAGIDTNMPSELGITPLMQSCLYNNAEYEEFVSVLISRSDNINHQDNIGKTALMEACRYGTRGMIILLLEAGAQIDITNQAGNNALYEVQHKKR